MTILERVLCKLFHHIDIEEGGKVYLRRWFIYPRYPQMKKLEPRIYLHKFHNGDNLRDPHNHPWRFTSIILKGGYWEHSLNPEWQRLRAKGLVATAYQTPRTVRKWYGPGSILRRGAKWTHAVELPLKLNEEALEFGLQVETDEPIPCWSLIKTGVKEQTWGFFTEKGFCNHRDYKNGVCWCHEGEEKK